VPDWVDARKEVEKEEALAKVELGKRHRKEVNYADVMSDNRWLKIVDAGDDPEVEMERILKRRK
jgi:hypothetical protein